MYAAIIEKGYRPANFVLFFAVILLHLFFALTVYLNGKRRYLDNPVYWSVFSVIFGLPAFIMFFALNAGQGVESKAKTSSKAALSVLLAVSLCCGFAFVPMMNYEAAYTYSHYNCIVLQKKNPFKYVTYDKMGNEYDVSLLDFYDDLNRFDGMGYDNTVTVYNRDGEACGNRDDFVIDSDGYAVEDFDYDKYECRSYENDDVYIEAYFDKDGNIFYDGYSCSWDKDGNLVFYGLDEELTVDNTKSTEEEVPEVNGFAGYSYYDSIQGDEPTEKNK